MRLFESSKAIADYLDGVPDNEQSLDGVWLIQDHISSPEPYITRCEFIGGRFHYAVHVDTRDGFELCPADACQVDEEGGPVPKKFTIDQQFDDPILSRYLDFLTASEIEIAGIEFIRDCSGGLFTYDVNTNTNYNAQAEADARVSLTGMEAIACFLGEEWARLPDQAASH